MVVPEHIKHANAFQVMCNSLPAARVEEWSPMVEMWEKESAEKEPCKVEALNPYELKVAGESVAFTCIITLVLTLSRNHTG
jgi:hypothetical protein